MGDRVFVVEVVSDGPMGYPYDEVLSVGVCSVDLDAGDFDSVYDAVIAWEPKYLGKEKLDYAEANGLETMLLYDGVPEDQVASELLEVLKDQYVTSYDVRNVFGRYLTNKPWDVTFHTHIMGSIMARQPISLRSKRPEDEPGTIVKAYRRTFGRDDPANVGRKRGALELAQMASELAISLRERGKFRFSEAEHRRQRPEDRQHVGGDCRGKVDRPDRQQPHHEKDCGEYAAAHREGQEHHEPEEQEAHCEQPPSGAVPVVEIYEAQAQQPHERGHDREQARDLGALPPLADLPAELGAVDAPPAAVPSVALAGHLPVASGTCEGVLRDDRSAVGAVASHRDSNRPLCC